MKIENPRALELMSHPKFMGFYREICETDRRMRDSALKRAIRDVQNSELALRRDEMDRLRDENLTGDCESALRVEANRIFEKRSYLPSALRAALKELIIRACIKVVAWENQQKRKNDEQKTQ